MGTGWGLQLTSREGRLAAVALAGAGVLVLLRRDNWAVIRTHPWACVRQVYHQCALRAFARRLERAAAALPPVPCADDAHPGSAELLEVATDRRRNPLAWT